MFRRILTRPGPGTVHRRPDCQPKQAGRRPIAADTPGKQRQPVDFDAFGLHQHNAMMHVDDYIGLWPGGQLDLVLKKDVGFLKRLPLGLGITTRCWRLGRAPDAEAGDRKQDCDEEPFVAQIRK